MRDVKKTFDFGGNYVEYFRFGDDSALEVELETRDHNHFVIWMKKDGNIDYKHEKGKYIPRDVFNRIRYKRIKEFENRKNPFLGEIEGVDYESIKHNIESENKSDLEIIDYILQLIDLFYGHYEEGDINLIDISSN